MAGRDPAGEGHSRADGRGRCSRCLRAGPSP
nr:MAG TPA: hypothetical protein [Caudoviricetes sp.]